MHLKSHSAENYSLSSYTSQCFTIKFVLVIRPTAQHRNNTTTYN